MTPSTDPINGILKLLIFTTIIRNRRKLFAVSRSIYITEFDLKRLRELVLEAGRSGYHGSAYLDHLRGELDRANIVRPAEIPSNVITMNSRVLMQDADSGEEMTLTLVFPQDADVLEDKISVLAPIGTAMLGYCEGDTIDWEVPDGLRHLVVKKVLYQPEASGDMDL